MPSASEYLISAQHESGGWGYKTGHKPVVEPTALVLLAMRDEPQANQAFTRGLKWLLDCQHQDGGWGINEEDDESGWQTAWALTCLMKSNENEASIARGTEWLSMVPTYLVTQEQLSQAQVPQSDAIGALVWPWLPGQAGWTEPTALAVLALDHAASTPLVKARTQAAVQYFEHFRTASGGWNVGNAGPLDTNVKPRTYPTSLVLMALARVDQQAIQSVDIAALRNDLEIDRGMLAQAAGLTALRVLGNNDEPLIHSLSSKQLNDGSWEHSPFVTAWAMMALRGYL